MKRILAISLLLAIPAAGQITTSPGSSSGSSGGDPSLPGPRGVVYLSSSGSDANQGTLAAPKLTPAAAMSAVGGSGTIIVRGGDYTTGFDCANAIDLTIRAYPGERPRFLFGSVIASNSFSSLSNGIWTATVTQAQSNNITFLTNRWDAWSPLGRGIYLFQTNAFYGANNKGFFVPSTTFRLTETNRCEMFPLLHTNNISTMTNKDGFWSLQGNVLYVKFNTSNHVGSVWIPGTNSTDSVIYGGTAATELNVHGLSSYFGYNGFDFSGMGSVRAKGCYVLGASVGFNYEQVNGSAPYEGEAELMFNEALLCQGQGSQFGGSTVDGRILSHVYQAGNVWHDNLREGSSARSFIRRVVVGDYCAFNGMPGDLAGFGFIDDGSHSSYIGCSTISNSATGWQAGDAASPGVVSFQSLKACSSISDWLSVTVDDFTNVVEVFNCFLNPAGGTTVNITAVNRGHTVTVGGNVMGAGGVGSPVISGSLSGNVTTEYAFGIGSGTIVDAGSMELRAASSAYGATLGALDVGSSFITVRGTASSYFGGPIGLHTNAIATWPAAGQVGGDAFLINSNGSPARIRGTSFATTLVSTNTF